MNQPSVRSFRHRYNRLPHKESGAVAIIVALSLVALVGFVGLALDLGKLFVAKTELQNSADACALAAARELTGANTNQLVLAEAAGVTTGERHNVLFQGEQIKISSSSSVTFSETLTGSYRSAFTGPSATNMRFARCEVNRTGIANWLIQVLNILPGVTIGDQTVTASAVATLSPSQVFSCPIPVGICDTAIEEAVPGSWLSGVVDAGNSVTGSFGWIDFTPPQGGASELVGIMTSACDVTNLPALGNPVNQTGANAALAMSYNSRFGLYHGNINQSNSIPDKTGYAYYPGIDGVPINPAPGQIIDMFNSSYVAKASAYAPYQGNAYFSGTSPELAPNFQSQLNTAQHQSLGKDNRRVAIAAITSGTCPGGPTVTGWACVLMLNPINHSGNNRSMWLEYLGLANDPASPCATIGIPAGPNGTGPMVPALVR